MNIARYSHDPDVLTNSMSCFLFYHFSTFEGIQLLLLPWPMFLVISLKDVYVTWQCVTVPIQKNLPFNTLKTLRMNLSVLMGLKLKLLPDLMPSLNLVYLLLYTFSILLCVFLLKIWWFSCVWFFFSFMCKDTFIQRTKKLYQDTRTQRNIAKLNDELYEVHQIMTRNVQEVLGVGEKLDRKTFFNNLSFISFSYNLFILIVSESCKIIKILQLGVE